MGNRFPGWKRSFFVGGLREGETPRTGQIQRIEFNEKWEEIRREPMLRELKQRIGELSMRVLGRAALVREDVAGLPAEEFVFQALQ